MLRLARTPSLNSLGNALRSALWASTSSLRRQRQRSPCIHNPFTDLVARGGSGGGPGGGGDGGSALPDQANAGDFPELAENERNRKLLGAMF